jgi:hypothetical protein
VVNAKDIAMLERLLLGNDDDDNIEPLDSVAHLDNFTVMMRPMIPIMKIIPNTCNTMFFNLCFVYIF